LQAQHEPGISKGWKKRVTAETPNPAFQDEIMEILCVSKLLKLEAKLLKWGEVTSLLLK